MKKLLAIFAHPDDEGAIGGTLAHYTRHDTDVTLICATRGEVGEISDDALATPETLGQVRTAELQAACNILGINPPIFLDYRDSGMVDTPPNEHPDALIQADTDQFTRRVADLIREIEPEVVITFEPFGWYGHPDHQFVSRWATAACKQVIAEEKSAETAPRLFHCAMPFNKFKALTDYALEQGWIEEANFDDIPEEKVEEAMAQVTHVLDVTKILETKLASMFVHQTQFGANSWFRKLPMEVIRPVWGYEYFIQVHPTPVPGLRTEPASRLW